MCDAVFGCHSILKTHLLFHTCERQFKNNWYYVALNLSCNLKVHIHTHMGKTCLNVKHVMHAVFSENMKLNKHTIAHTHWFKCKVRDAVFNRNDYESDIHAATLDNGSVYLWLRPKSKTKV